MNLGMMTKTMRMVMEENKNWWDSDWYKEWQTLTKKRKRDFSFPEGRWGCYINDSGELMYKFIKWNEI